MDTAQNGIDQLINKLKKEVEEETFGKKEKIIKEAQEKAQQIVEEAKMQAKLLLKEAQNLIHKEKVALAMEMELAARDFSLKLTERLKKQLFFPIIKKEARLTFKDPDFFKQMLKELLLEFVKTNSSNLDVLVSKEIKESMAAYLASSVFDELENNPPIKLLDEENLEGFVLLQKQDHYVWDFRVETIAKELSRLVEPSLRKYFSLQTKQTSITPIVSQTV